MPDLLEWMHHSTARFRVTGVDRLPPGKRDPPTGFCGASDPGVFAVHQRTVVVRFCIGALANTRSKEVYRDAV
jgi:hypothetical protein